MLHFIVTTFGMQAAANLQQLAVEVMPNYNIGPIVNDTDIDLIGDMVSRVLEPLYVSGVSAWQSQAGLQMFIQVCHGATSKPGPLYWLSCLHRTIGRLQEYLCNQ